MALPGRAPKEVRLGRGLSAEWTDVPHVPYDGPSPDLPEHDDFLWYPEVRSWWEIVRRMPHCVLWEASDWRYALDTAYMWQDWWRSFYSGPIFANKSVEIRRREDQMGYTIEARRKLRIRYVEPREAEPAPTKPKQGKGAAKVTDIGSRRNRLAG